MERDPGAERWVPAPRVPGVVVAMSLGAAWGAAGYALLWGHTPVTVHRTFVVSPLGTLLLLPVRAVLASIRVVEEHVVGHPFQFADRNGWIGLVAAAVGSLIAATAFLAVRGLVRRAGPPREEAR